MHRTLVLFVFVLFFSIAAFAQSAEQAVRHVEVYSESDRFCGWPANNGIWIWDQEIVVGFVLGYYKKDPKGSHDIDRDKPSERLQARSLDGGETWTVETPGDAGQANGADLPATLKQGIDFSNPDLALKFAGGSFFYSYDRCKTWQGPYALPTFDRPGLLCRTDYIIESPTRVSAFIAAQKEGGKEGQPLCIRTTDGGKTWNLVGWIGKQPPAQYGYAIMPATVALENNGYLSIIRRSGLFDGVSRRWLEAFVSPDDGRSWYMLDQPHIDNGGNPATLTRLADGALAMTYGWRHAPYGIRARVSRDEGQTWSREIILRSDGASWDLGYPRTVQRPDGKCVTVYYFHPQARKERTIAATIWEPVLRTGR